MVSHTITYSNYQIKVSSTSTYKCRAIDYLVILVFALRLSDIVIFNQDILEVSI